MHYMEKKWVKIVFRFRLSYEKKKKLALNTYFMIIDH